MRAFLAGLFVWAMQSTLAAFAYLCVITVWEAARAADAMAFGLSILGFIVATTLCVLLLGYAGADIDTAVRMRNAELRAKDRPPTPKDGA